MSVKINRGSTLASLSITPLIDVVFLLLIFFLVASRFDDEERTLDIRLPQATEAVPLMTEPQEMVVNINVDGQYVVAGEVMTFDVIRGHFETDWKEKATDSSVIIRGDERAPFGAIVAIADLCQAMDVPYTTIAKEKPAD